MTTHPEDAMTRERALLARIDKLFDEKEQYYVPDVSAIDVRMSYPMRRKYGTLDEMREAIRALASAQQEPALAADAEELPHERELKLWAGECAEEIGALNGYCDETPPIIVRFVRDAFQAGISAAARAKPSEKGGAR